MCGSKFTFQHFLCSEMLGKSRVATLELAVERDDWWDVAVAILSRFKVYLHLICGGELRAEESELFDLLNVVEGEEPVLTSLF